MDETRTAQASTQDALWRARLLSWMSEHGLSRHAMAAGLGVDVAQVSRVVSGVNRIGPAFVGRFVMAYGLDAYVQVFGPGRCPGDGALQDAPVGAQEAL